MNVTVIGAGLAGSEAAWQLAQRGIDVTLWEMKPVKRTPAHVTDDFAELCCSNSLRSDQLENAVGLLKEEMRRLGSLILACADATRVPSGGALAVDRHGFARMVTEKIRSHPRITVREGEVTELPDGEVIVASGPLTAAFMLPFAMGVVTARGGNVMTDAFGVVAMVAMMPLITVQIMGLIASLASRRRALRAPEPLPDEYEVIELWEGV